MRNISEPQPVEFTVLDFPTRVARATLLLAMSFCIMACSKSTEKPTAKLRPVKYATVGASGVSVAPAISGSIIARDATLLSFRVGGTLAVLNVKMGDTVKKGQLIGKLDDSDYAVALSQAQANFQSAKSQRDAAQNTFNRVERLFESGTSSQADYEGARSTLQAAKAQQSAASQVVKQARNQQGYAVLKSPFAGVVNSVSSKQGESVAAGQPIIIVSRGGELEVSVGIPADMVS
ncbi:MAG: efflux RND transporter periplasmic adaptor subunit, partial [Kofleriaceae bacterium]|nr:efflux RND transporter periplasmic adaptor subunit [Kofleriaceae bacterium]